VGPAGIGRPNASTARNYGANRKQIAANGAANRLVPYFETIVWHLGWYYITRCTDTLGGSLSDGSFVLNVDIKRNQLSADENTQNLETGLRTATDKTVSITVSNVSHVLHTALPPPPTASQHYDLRRRSHTLSLPEHVTYLLDCNFITRMLYKHGY